ncbi:MAG: thymidylate synthase [Bacteroidetes bacterium]|nr:MAG: thymidylate synthase [Bacteroidota bacterium]TAG93452.1 MAG: thymidylate synthase [Bacteroidota bacterium]
MEKDYLQLLKNILENGYQKNDRTGIGTKSIFGYQMRHDLNKGFPLLTTKKVHWKSIVYELLWFLRGDTNIKFLTENNITIWNEWADENGELGDVYGKQWRNWQTNDGKSIDQISEVIEQIKKNPDSRRHIVSAWNVGEISKMKLPPCHLMFQFGVYDQKISCHLLMRSVDCFLGMPFNIASYALLTQMIAQVCDLGVGELVLSTVDTHIYNNHFEQVQLQITREPFELPTLKLNQKIKNIFDFTFDDIILENYISHAGIKAQVAV